MNEASQCQDLTYPVSKGLRAFDLLEIVPVLVPKTVDTVTPNKIVPTMVPTMWLN